MCPSCECLPASLDLIESPEQKRQDAEYWRVHTSQETVTDCLLLLVSSNFKKLRSLNLSECWRIIHDRLGYIAEGCQQLSHLDLSYTLMSTPNEKRAG